MDSIEINEYFESTECCTADDFFGDYEKKQTKPKIIHPKGYFNKYNNKPENIEIRRKLLDKEITCECGSKILYGSQYKHYVTKKHIKNMEQKNINI